MPIVLSKSKNRAKNECRSLAFNADVYVLHRVHEMDTFLGKKADAKKDWRISSSPQKNCDFSEFLTSIRKSGHFLAQFVEPRLHHRTSSANVPTRCILLFATFSNCLFFCNLAGFQVWNMLRERKYLGQCKVGLCDKQFQGFFKRSEMNGFCRIFLHSQ